MFRLFMFYTGRFTFSSPPPPPSGIIQMTTALQRIGDCVL